MTSAEAAEYLSVTERTLKKWRSDGTGPTWLRLGTTRVRYTERALDEYIAARQNLPTASWRASEAS